MSTDTYYANVSLLTHFDGANGADYTTFVDNGPNAFTWTIIGGGQSGLLTTTEKKWGTASVKLSVAGSAWNGKVAANAAFSFGSGDFTIEFWAKDTGEGYSSTAVIVVSNGDFASFQGWQVRRNVNALEFFSSSVGASYDVASGTAVGTVGSTFEHYAIVREGNTWSTYKAGARTSTFTSAATTRAVDGANGFWMGDSREGVGLYIDDLRITKGVARYSGASYTVPGEAFGAGTMGGAAAFNTMTASACAPGGQPSFRTMTGSAAAAPGGAGLFSALTAAGTAVGGGHADAAVSFLPMTASVAMAPTVYARFAPMTATGAGVGGSGATATLYSKFLPATAVGTSTAASVASGAGVFAAATASGRGPQSTDISFKVMTALGVGTVGTIARGALSFLDMEAAVAQLGGSVAQGTGRFQAGTATSRSATPGLATGAATFARAYARVSAQGGSVARGAPGFLAVVASAVGVEPSVGTGAVSFLPAIAAALAQETIADTWASYALNVSNEALTQYQNYHFNSMASFNGRNLAAGPGGIVELAGTTDAGAAIAWSARTGFMDGSGRGGMPQQDSMQLKRLDELLLAMRFTGPVRVRVWTDESTYFDYNIPNYRSGDLHQVRAKLGKGLKSRYYRVELSGLNNAAAEISSLQLPMMPLRRRAG